MRPALRYPLRRRLPVLLFLIGALSLLPVALLCYGIYQNRQSVRITEDVNVSSSLRYRSLDALLSARAGDTEAVRRQQSAMSEIRRDLDRHYPPLVSQTDGAWLRFVARTDETTAKDMLASSYRLTESIIAQQRASEHERNVVFALALICLLAVTPIGLISVARFARSEAATRESEERFQAAIDVMHDGLVVQNESGAIVVCNRRAEEILGLTASQMAGRTALDARWRAIHPDGTDWPGQTHPATIALTQGTPSWDNLMGVHKPDGTLTWIDVNADPLFHERTDKTPDKPRKPRGVIATFSDVTYRRRLEAEREIEMQKTVERADRDPLTDLYNHRLFHQRLRSESGRALAQASTIAVIVMDMDNFKFFNDTYGHAVGDQVLCLVANTLRAVCRSEDTLARIGGDEFALLLPDAERAVAWERARYLRGRVQALSFQPPGEEAALPLRLSVGIAMFPEETSSSAEAVYIADKRALQNKGGEIGAAASPSETLRVALRDSTDGFAMLDALVAAVDNKDRYTFRHSEDVMVLSGLIGRRMGLTEEEARSLEIAALLHDVGKIGVPVRILRQPGALSGEGLEAMRQHPVLSGILVGAVPELAHTLPAVRHHHERWNGGGYPDGLAGDAIPLAARILAVADAYSAMTTNRPYRLSRTRDEALAILHDGKGQQWDPRCVEAFAAAMDEMPKPTN